MGTIIDPPTNPFGLSPVDFTFAVAANNSQTTARVFAHGINSTVVLQPEQGRLCLHTLDVILPSSCLRLCCNCCYPFLHVLACAVILLPLCVTPAHAYGRTALHKQCTAAAAPRLTAIKPHTGVYNETVFKALDYIIYRAKYYGVKLILTLGDQWNTADSKINYLEWGNATDNTNLFFTSPTIQGYYKQHILTMLNRNVSQLTAQIFAASRACAYHFCMNTHTLVSSSSGQLLTAGL